MPTVLITGGSGFFGQHLCRRFLQGGYKVRVLDRTPFHAPDLESKIEFIQGDLQDSDVVLRAVSGCEIVIHNAAVVPLSRAGKEYWNVNVNGTRNVLAAAHENHVRKLVHISTSAVYGDPVHMPIDETTPFTPFGQYGRSKQEAESLCQTFKKNGLDITIIRPRPILGSGRLGILYLLLEWIREGKNFYIMGSGRNKFQLISAQDLAQVCWLAFKKPCLNEDFNIGTETFSTLREDLEALAQHAGTGSRIISLPVLPARVILWFLDLLHLAPLVGWHYRLLERDFWFSTEKAKRILGWSSRQSNVQMLIATYDWYSAHYREYEHFSGTTHQSKVKMGLLNFLKKIS